VITRFSVQFRSNKTVAATSPPPRVLSLLIMAFWTALPRMITMTRS